MLGRSSMGVEKTRQVDFVDAQSNIVSYWVMKQTRSAVQCEKELSVVLIQISAFREFLVMANINVIYYSITSPCRGRINFLITLFFLLISISNVTRASPLEKSLLGLRRK